MDEEVESTSTTASIEPPGHDIFCTPENSEFLSQVEYKDLNPSAREIRLLKILPNSGSRFIECELLPSVRLADVHKQYLALSYCAGDVRNTKPILVNGARCNVFANLHHALNTVRYYWKTHTYHRDLFLWVDQICINQANLAERSHQVGFMRAIYESAKETLICLSVADTIGDGMRWLVELEQILVNRLIIGDTVPSEFRLTPSHPFVLTHQFRTELQGRLEDDEFADGWIKFCDVLNSPWWGRAWVFQEFMVSYRATFLHGLHSMAYPDMLRLICDVCLATLEILFERHRTRGTRVRKKLKRAQATRAKIAHSITKVLSVLLAKKEWFQSFDLKRLLVYTQNCQSSDERDRIYSMIGLAHPGYALTPDYSSQNKIENLLVQTTKRIITFEDSLDVLSYLSRGDPSSSGQGELLPSWVVDWTKVQNTLEPMLYRTNMDWDGSKFVAHYIKSGCADASFVQVPHPVYSELGTTALQVWAVFLDSKLMIGRHEIFAGKNGFLFRARFPVQHDDELWVLCGSSEPFLLRRCSGGYRIVGPVLCLTFTIQPPMREFANLSKYTDESGDLDPFKMERKRITIF
ncbi:heterokaryon incompatibility 6 OR allele [Fusarium tjaetaba]|uniref:Heterokaryon incompatibility 6 OR allele n=1 Tax=Fusarium tjaetaba TaxID=1567544 RepID=A0A8H5S646_9HYPO|nr:heterokaryon incompatibility 6 OR allele [Fusarium tjaetaba]KAF5645928.1 heterokaryon incompatibility 6 OR allele [Fusarium tjaetaba]